MDKLEFEAKYKSNPTRKKLIYVNIFGILLIIFLFAYPIYLGGKSLYNIGNRFTQSENMEQEILDYQFDFDEETMIFDFNATLKVQNDGYYDLAINELNLSVIICFSFNQSIYLGSISDELYYAENHTVSISSEKVIIPKNSTGEIVLRSSTPLNEFFQGLFDFFEENQDLFNEAEYELENLEELENIELNSIFSIVLEQILFRFNMSYTIFSTFIQLKSDYKINIQEFTNGGEEFAE